MEWDEFKRTYIDKRPDNCVKLINEIENVIYTEKAKVPEGKPDIYWGKPEDMASIDISEYKHLFIIGWEKE